MQHPGIWIHTICSKNGLVLTENQIGLFEQYVTLLLDWNKKVNLISRKDEDRVWQSHILHSISLLFKLKLVADPTILDLGTGGGMPGIPLKILLPQSQIVLVDSTRKKIAAVQDMISNLRIGGIEAVWGRAEDLSTQSNLVSHFDYIVARAVAPLSDLIKWSAPFLRYPRSQTVVRPADPTLVPPPALLALKGGLLDDEVSKARRIHKDLSINIMNLVFPGSEELSAIDKKVVIVDFPIQPNIPKGSPERG